MLCGCINPIAAWKLFEGSTTSGVYCISCLFGLWRTANTHRCLEADQALEMSLLKSEAMLF